MNKEGVEGDTRDLALIPFYAGLRLGEVVALDTGDIHLSARKGLIIVRAINSLLTDR
jgi:integrase